MDRKEILKSLSGRRQLLEAMELMGPQGRMDAVKSEKLGEVAGFAGIIIRYLERFPLKKDTVTVLECSCGKSYLGFVLSILIPEVLGKRVCLLGVDFNKTLIERCEAIAGRLGLADARFLCARTVELVHDKEVDMVLSLHACDTATDEALVQGIRSGAGFVHAVPCCQNQIRGQIRSGHPLEVMTGYGPVRYRLANLLTDVLRAEFMKAAGYHVEMDEIGSPKLTPKNLCISARKVRRKSARRRDSGYRMLKDMFGVSTALEKMCPEVIAGQSRAVREAHGCGSG